MKKLTAALSIVMSVSLLVAPTGARADGGDRTPVIDPSGMGRYSVDAIDYHGGHVVLTDTTGAPIVEELKGIVYVPEEVRGPLPLLVFIHGRHASCRVLSVELLIGARPCPDVEPVMADIRSYAGYDYLATNLASHGFVVASITANAINSYDFPVSWQDSGMLWRAQLVGETIDLMSRWNEAPGPQEVADRLIGRVDLKRIGLMGHSRGGEGVARFVTYNKRRESGPRYKGLKAVFALAPTDFYEEKVPGVHFGTIVPLCDGDVYNLQGAWMFDAAESTGPAANARVQWAINGANHNYFNTVWTYDDGEFGGDDTGTNPVCVPGNRGVSARLSADEQRAVGLGLMAAFFRRYVGGEEKLDPLMTGAATLPNRACGGPCDGMILTSYLGPGARVLIGPSKKDVAYRAAGGLDVGRCAPQRSTGAGCPTAPNRSPGDQLSLEWTKPGKLLVSTEGVDASMFRALTFRTAVNFKDARNRPGEAADFEVVLIDSKGRAAAVPAARYSTALKPPAGPEHQQIVLNGVRIPLSEFSVDLGDIARIELRFGGAVKQGSIQLSDLAFQERR